MTSQIYKRFTKAITPKVTTLPPKPKSQIVSQLLHFWWRIPLGYLVFDELKMTSFLLALGLIIAVCWEHTAVNGGRGERAETQHFGYEFISGHVWNKLTRFQNGLVFTMQAIFHRRFWSSDTVSPQNSPSFHAVYFSGQHICLLGCPLCKSLSCGSTGTQWAGLGRELAEK